MNKKIITKIFAVFILSIIAHAEKQNVSVHYAFTKKLYAQEQQPNLKKYPVVIAARIGGDNQHIRFVLDLNRYVNFNAFILPDPFRVVIDMPKTTFNLPPNLGLKGRGLVQQYRYGEFTENISRVVLDMNSPVIIERAFTIPAENNQPARIVVDIIKTEREKFNQAQNVEKNHNPLETLLKQLEKENTTENNQKNDDFNIAAILKQLESNTPATHAIPPIPKPKPNIKSQSYKPLIVLDPGHGGVDPGAISQSGIREKDVVLKFSLQLRDAIRKTGKYRVKMTRERDTFLPLRTRVTIARKAKADLFIAIHADSIQTRKNQVRGATVYTLSEHASDKEAALLAARENRADIIAGVSLKKQNNTVRTILIDLAQRETKNNSIKFAKNIIETLKNTTPLNVKPLRYAGFRVLKAPDIPSILLELGYLSNYRDEKNLISKKWRYKIAQKLTEAINVYFKRQTAYAIHE